MKEEHLTIKSVEKLTGLNRFQIRFLENKGLFPKRTYIGKYRVAWKAHDITVWINKKQSKISPNNLQRSN